MARISTIPSEDPSSVTPPMFAGGGAAAPMGQGAGNPQQMANLIRLIMQMQKPAGPGGAAGGANMGGLAQLLAAKQGGGTMPTAPSAGMPPQAL